MFFINLDYIEQTIRGVVCDMAAAFHIAYKREEYEQIIEKSKYL